MSHSLTLESLDAVARSALSVGCHVRYSTAPLCPLSSVSLVCLPTSNNTIESKEEEGGKKEEEKGRKEEKKRGGGGGRRGGDEVVSTLNAACFRPAPHQLVCHSHDKCCLVCRSRSKPMAIARPIEALNLVHGAKTKNENENARGWKNKPLRRCTAKTLHDNSTKTPFLSGLFVPPPSF